MTGAMLADLTVLDLSHYIAGPFCTRQFSDLGATVIKIERPTAGDPARMLGPFPEDMVDPERCGLFLDLNTGKQSVTLELRRPAGRDLALRLAAGVDLVVENFAPRVLPALGLDFAALSAVNPRIVLCSISNFGQYGPLRDAPASELTIQAMGARFSEMGLRPRQPLRMAPHATQYLAGLTAATACLAALADLEAEARHLDIAILDALLAQASRQYQQYAFTGVNLPRATAARPMQLLRAADGYLVVSLALGWDRVCVMLDRPELAGDERFRSLGGRMAHSEELEALLADWALDLPVEEVFRRARGARVAASPVRDVPGLLGDQQYLARGFFQTIEHPQAGALTHPGIPYHSSEHAIPPRQPAPLLGQHTEAVLRERLGLDSAQIAALRAEGVI
jgi:glutaryl-CoA transferase